MPSVLKDCRACKPTKPMPRYISDGSGRDLIISFSREANPPNFNFLSKNRPHHLPSKEKRGNAKIQPLSKFVPDGSGRDLFQQQNNDYVFPVKNQIKSEAISPKRSNISNYNRPKANPRFKPSGSGRDMSYTDIDVYRTTTAQNSFKILKPSTSNAQMLRPRTSPPPRFVSSGAAPYPSIILNTTTVSPSPCCLSISLFLLLILLLSLSSSSLFTGSGRDTFQNSSAHRPASSHCPEREGFAYGSQSISQNARYRYGKSAKTSVSQNETMKRLCSANNRSPSSATTTTARAKSASAVRRPTSTAGSNNFTFDDYFEKR